MNASRPTLTRLTEIPYAKAGKTNTSFGDIGKDRIPTIKKIDELRQKLTRKFNTSEGRFI